MFYSIHVDLLSGFREAYCSVGYTPILTFDVPDLQDALTKSLALGAQMDGAVQYFAHGKVRFLV